MLPLLHKTAFVGFEISNHQCSCKHFLIIFKWFIPVVCESNIKYQKDIGWLHQTQQFIMV